MGTATVKILDRYIGRTVAGSIILVMLVVLSVYTFLEFMDELGDIGKGNYDTAAAVQYIVLTMPGRAYELFPSAALLGTLLGLSALAHSSELVVMRTAGLSVLRITGAVMRVGLVLMVLAVGLGEWAAPPTDRYAEAQRSVALSGRIASVSRLGLWVRDQLTYINIRELLPGMRLGDIFVYQFDPEHRLISAAHAREATYLDDRWLFKDIHFNRISTAGVVTEHIPQASWESVLSPDLISVVAADPRDLSALGLYRYIRYLHENYQDAERYELALWIKLATPFATAAMVVLAVAFVFGPLRALGMGQRVVLGALLGLSFHLLNRTLSYLGIAYDLNPVFSATFPTLLALTLALWLLHRAR